MSTLSHAILRTLRGNVQFALDGINNPMERQDVVVHGMSPKSVSKDFNCYPSFFWNERVELSRAYSRLHRCEALELRG